MNRSENPGLYVHVPFCRSKCAYCDFASVTSLALVEPWIQAVEQEALLYEDAFRGFDTLYLGGGTPSLLGSRELTLLVDGLFRHLPISSDAEITIEMNPDDVSPERMNLLRELGFNRISLGVQSFEDDELAWLGRRHTARRAVAALQMIRGQGFQNVGIDLIYGLGNQSEHHWVNTLECALGFAPEHLSCYMLTLEEGTPLFKRRAEGKVATPGESAQGRLFLLTSEILESHGYIHYEVSNFARTERHGSLHNQKYWAHTPYLGLGPAAHSFSGGARWWNVSSVEAYCTQLASGRKPIEEKEILTTDQIELEAFYFGFRTLRGIDAGRLAEKPRAREILRRLTEDGLVKISGRRVIPTRRGYLLADSLPLEFLD